MPFITKAEGKKLALKSDDYKALAEITRVRKMKRWKSGYTPMQIRNFTIYGHTCSPEIKELIINYKKG